MSTFNETLFAKLVDHVDQLESDFNDFKTDVDTTWLLIGGTYVLFMHCGFTMLEVGSVNMKNTKSILIKNVFDMSLGAILWWLVGHGIAFGESNSRFGGKADGEIGGFAFTGDQYDVDKVGNDYGYNWASWFFQFAFAATCVTIVSGSIAERVAVGAYLTYAVVLIALVYPVVVHWVWNGDGWASAWRSDNDLLLGCGAIDFAGSGVIHMTGGIAAMIACIVTGPRMGRFNDDGTVNFLQQQNPALQSLGTLILWFGWYGFNGASTLYVAGFSGVAAKVMVNSTIAAGSGAITCVLAGAFIDGVIDQAFANNGVLVGLVAITAGCATVEPEGAFIIGIISAFVYQGFTRMQRRLRIDDVIDAAPVHFANGLWGMLATGLFTTKDNYKLAYYADRAGDCCGAFYGCGGSQFGAQVITVVAILGWTGALTTILFLSIKYTIGMRLPAEMEIAGLDVSKHGGHAFPEMVQFEEMSKSRTGGTPFMPIPFFGDGPFGSRRGERSNRGRRADGADTAPEKDEHYVPAEDENIEGITNQA